MTTRADYKDYVTDEAFRRQYVKNEIGQRVL